MDKLIKINDLHKGFEILLFSDYCCGRQKQYRNNLKGRLYLKFKAKGCFVANYYSN